MDPKLSKYSEQENQMHNGQMVMGVLSNLGDAATADKICDEIVYMSQQPKEVIEPEVKRILRRGITNGFLVKFGKNYLLAGEGDSVEVDSKRQSYQRIGKRNKRKRNIKSVEQITDEEDDNYRRISKNVELKLTNTDSTDQQLVLLNPKEVVNGIITDLYNLVNPSEEQTSDDQDEDNVIDLEAILSKNLTSLSKPFDEVME